MFEKTTVRLLVAAGLAAVAVSAQADVFHMPSGQTSLSFAKVGDPNNAADPSTGYGAVSYTYDMAKYDTTVGQYCQFLNAVAKTDPYGLYNSYMGTEFPTIAITRSGSSGNYSYAVTGSDSQAANCPIALVTWGDAARFCNWLQNGQPATGVETSATTEDGAYALNGATSQAALMAVTSPAHSGSGAAGFFLPTENEWYKAAYYKSGTSAGYWSYPTQSDSAPSNVLSAIGTNNANFGDMGYTDPVNDLTPVGYFADSPGPYGTYDMGGDVWQWEEGGVDGVYRSAYGGCWNQNVLVLNSDIYGTSYASPTSQFVNTGFRVASSEPTPEPASLALLLAGGFCLLAYAWRRRRQAAWAKA